MKIAFNENILEQPKVNKNASSIPSSIKTSENQSYKFDKSEQFMREFTYKANEGEKSLIPIGDETTIKNKRNQMTIMSSMLSEEEFGKMMKDGTSCMDMDIEETVTIIDKMKAEMIKAGNYVEGYTDDLDVSQLSEITGSQVMAQNLSAAYAKCQVPLTKENVEQGMEALNLASELVPISEDTSKYLVKNELEPTIENVYKAQFSSVKEAQASSEAIQYTKDLNKQIEEIVQKAGYEPSKEIMEDAKWLLSQDIPLTKGSFEQYEQIKQIQLPLTLEETCQSIASAVIKGKPALQANLFDVENIYEKALHMEEDVFNQLKSDIGLKRQAEEIRLMMTTEANIKLIKSGYYIDTEDLETFVDLLKEQEKKVAEKMFDKSIALPQLEIYNQVNAERNRLFDMSNAFIGKINVTVETFTLHELYEAVDLDCKAYEKANAQYEKCMTEIRTDLGDSIKQAFRNVDDILQDLNFPLIEENQKAIRALGYNGMELTPENIEAVKGATHMVEKTISKMTPPTVVKMIKDGINPLEHTFSELNEYFDQLEPSFAEESEKYSKYLYRLEQNNEITPQEKEAYIGIYRLLNQIEKSDQKAVGQVVEQGLETEFASLLTSIRTSKLKNMDILVDEKFGELKELVVKGVSVSDQINAGFKGNFTEKLATFDEAEAKAYSKEMVDTLKQLSGIENETIEICNRFSITTSPNNLLAVADMVEQKNQVFKKLNQLSDKSKKEIQKKSDQIEAAFNSKDEASSTYKDVIDSSMKLVEEATFTTANTTEDIKVLQLAHKQLSIATKMATREEYEIPMYIGEQLTSIHLVLQHKEEEAGTIDIQLVNSKEEEIRANIKVEGQDISCTIYYENDTDDSAKQLGSKFYEQLEANGIFAKEPVYNNGFVKQENVTIENQVETKDLYRLAKIFIHTVKQERS